VPRPRAQTRRPLVSWPLYRLLAVLALIPTLIAALAVREPALPPPPARPLDFDGSAAATMAASLLGIPAPRGPGEEGDFAAAEFIQARLEKAGYKIFVQDFGADLPDQANVPMRNVMGYLPGRQRELIAIIAHRDGRGTGADDNASATGVMLELARMLKPLAHERGMVFVSTDGGTTGGQGAAEFASDSPLAPRVSAAIVLDSVAAAAGTPLRILIRPERVARGTSPTLFRTTRSVITRLTSREPIVPGLLDQLSGLAIPYALAEQGPLLARGVPALTLTAGPPPDLDADFTSFRSAQLGEVGTVVANLVAQLDGAGEIEQGGRPAIFIGSRTVRGWLAQLAVVALLAPALASILDLAARCRRRQIAVAPGVKALAWRCAAWGAGLVALWLLPLFPGGLASSVAVAPREGAIGLTWSGVILAISAGLLVWRFVVRQRLVRGPHVSGADRTGGLVAALLGLAFASTLLIAFNPFTLILLLPALHLWLLMPIAARFGRRHMFVLWLLGFTAGIALVIEYAVRFHLGLSTPRALLSMAATGYLSPLISVCLTIAAASAAQLFALIAGRYAPAHDPVRGYN
jgi:peptidase M28-like protein